MRSGIPWSVKGIEPEAREAAKQAARRAGMTLGTWLNQVIMDTGTDEVDMDMDSDRNRGNDTRSEPQISFAPPQPQPSPYLPATQPRRPEVDLSPVADAVREVLQRVEQSDKRTIDITHRLEQSVAELAQRISRSDRGTEPEMVEQAQGLHPLERKLQQLTERLEETERNRGGFGKRAEDKGQIQALEKAVSAVVDHLDNAEKRTEESLDDIRKTLAQVASRVETNKQEEEREEARLKSQALEAHLNSFAGRMEKMEQSVNTVGGQAVEAALKAFSEKADAEQHKATIAGLQRNLTEATQRLERIEARHDETLRAFEATVTNIAKRLEELDKPRVIESRLDELGARLAHSEDMTLKAAQTVERAISEMSDSIHKTEGRSRETATALQATIERIGKRLMRVEKEAKAAYSGMVPSQAVQMAGAGFVPGGQGFPVPNFDMPAMASPQQAFADVPPMMHPAAAPFRAPSFEEPLTAPVSAPMPSSEFDPLPMEPPLVSREEAPPPFAHDEDETPPPPPVRELEYDEDELDDGAHISNPAQETAALANDFLAAARRAAQNAANNGRHAPPLLGAPSYEPQGYAQAAENRESRNKKILMGASLVVLLILLIMGAIRLINSEPAKVEQAATVTDVPGDMEASTETSKPVVPAATAPVAAPTAAVPVPVAQTPATQTDESPYVPAAPKTTAAKPRRAETITMPPNEQGPSATPAPAKPVATAPLGQNLNSQASLQQAAAGGNAAAQYQLGQRYADGEGVPVDLKQAASWYGKAANQGLAIAQYRLATLYEKGRGVTQDNGKARELYEKAATQGNIKAMHNLAVIHAEGRGVPQDFTTAAKWFGMAANYGLSDSQYNLAILLQRGLGIAQDPVQAYKWFSVGADAGDKGAAQKRDEMAKTLDPATLAKGKAAAQNWTRKVSNPEANGDLEGWNAGTTGSINPPVTDIGRAQSMLAKLGYDVGTANGAMNSQTRASIIAYQRKAALDQTGSVNAALLKSLEIASR